MKQINIVLHQPEIPQNTGNIARTCAATGSMLHIIKPMGFEIDDKKLKRAGLDYWKYLDLEVHESYEDFKYLEAEYPENFQLIEFATEMSRYFAAADLVVSRSGASTMSELASMKKAVILVPNHKLPGFHQVKNAENYVEAGAALLVRDQEQGVDEKELLKAINKMLKDDELRAKLSKKLGTFAKNDAAKELAQLVLAAAR